MCSAGYNTNNCKKHHLLHSEYLTFFVADPPSSHHLIPHHLIKTLGPLPISDLPRSGKNLENVSMEASALNLTPQSITPAIPYGIGMDRD